MKRSFSFGIVLASLALASCGGGSSDNTLLDPGGGVFATPEATTIQLLASSLQLPSDNTGVADITLTAVAKDANNNVIGGVAITFDAGGDSFASIAVNSTDVPAVTSSAGLLTAQLSNGIGGAVNRNMTITATDAQSGASAQLTVAVVGTRLTIEGPNALALNDVGDYLVVLVDSSGAGIGFEPVTITSSAGNQITASSTTTDQAGKLTFSLTASSVGSDTLTATGLGQTTTTDVSISNDVFTLTHAPSAGSTIPLAPASETLTLTWTINGVAQANQLIMFEATRGTLSAPPGMTDANGQISVTISSTSGGATVIKASNALTPPTSTSLSLEFVATSPTQITVDATPSTIGTGEQAEVIATVRDANDNLVKDQQVNFQIVSDDTNGDLTTSSAVTNSQGRASTFYTAGGSPGALNGVTISATINGTLIQAVTNISVSRSEFDFIIGTGNDIFSPTTAVHAQEWNIIMTDSVGNAVSNAQLQVSLRSIFYKKGFLVVDTPLGQWVFSGGSPQVCADEDANRNGILDIGEDFNASGQMEAGNVATVAAVPPGASATDPCADAGTAGPKADVVTNNQGIARVCVIWPQNISWWVDVQIEAQAGVSGSESSHAQFFNLPALAQDINDVNSSPPNVVSPFGADLDCGVPPPGLPLLPLP